MKSEHQFSLTFSWIFVKLVFNLCRFLCDLFHKLFIDSRASL